jgi:hypothetical protein
MYEAMLERLNRSPDWNPLKGSGELRLRNKTYWAIEQKTISVIVILVIFGADILLILSLIFGKSQP